MPATLYVGASFCCPRCGLRSIHDGACSACGTLRIDLAANGTESRLRHRFARALRARPRTRHPSAIAYVTFNVLVAIAFGVAAMHYASRVKTYHLVSSQSVRWIALGVGALVGRMVAAIVAVLGVAVVGVVRSARGIWRRSEVHEPAVRTPRSDDVDVPRDEVALEGVVRAADALVSLGAGLEGAVVGARGETRGAEIADALVAPLSVETAEGRQVRIDVEAGLVQLDAVGEIAVLGRGAPRGWGVVAGRVGTPGAERVETFTIADGAPVRVFGGAREENDGVVAIRGTKESPIVLDFTVAAP